MNGSEYPTHNCGKVLDFCTFHDTKIYFCIFCKKVISAKKEGPDIQISVYIEDDEKSYERDDETIEDLI
jgi:hypothetical protein